MAAFADDVGNNGAPERDLLFVLASSLAQRHKHIPGIWLWLAAEWSCLWAAPDALRHNRRDAHWSAAFGRLDFPEHPPGGDNEQPSWDVVHPSSCLASPGQEFTDLRACSDDLPPLCPSLPQGGLDTQVRLSFPCVDLHNVDCVWGAFTVEQLVELAHLVLQPLWSSTDEFSSVLFVCRVRVHCLVRPFLYEFAVLDPCRSCELHHRKAVGHVFPISSPAAASFPP